MHFQKEEAPQADGNAHVQMLSPRVRASWETTGIPSIVPPSPSRVLRSTAMRLVRCASARHQAQEGRPPESPAQRRCHVAIRSNKAGTQNEGPACETKLKKCICKVTTAQERKSSRMDTNVNSANAKHTCSCMLGRCRAPPQRPERVCGAFPSGGWAGGKALSS